MRQSYIHPAQLPTRFYAHVEAFAQIQYFIQEALDRIQLPPEQPADASAASDWKTLKMMRESLRSAMATAERFEQRETAKMEKQERDRKEAREAALRSSPHFVSFRNHHPLREYGGFDGRTLHEMIRVTSPLSEDEINNLLQDAEANVVTVTVPCKSAKHVKELVSRLECWKHAIVAVSRTVG